MLERTFHLSAVVWSWLASHARGGIGPVQLWQLCMVPVLAAIALCAWLPDPRGRRSRDAAFLGLALVAIALSVLPTLGKDYLESDEALFVAAARKLAVDPVFYRSVDTTTSGPLNIYVLTVPAWLGGQITLLSARVIGAALMCGLVVCLYVSC